LQENNKTFVNKSAFSGTLPHQTANHGSAVPMTSDIRRDLSSGGSRQRCRSQYPQMFFIRHDSTAVGGILARMLRKDKFHCIKPETLR